MESPGVHLPRKGEVMATVQEPAEQRLRLSLIPWETYVSYSDGLGPRHIRVTYDQGEMEIMTVSPRHENNKKRLAQLIEALTEEMNIERASFGSMTCRRE
jgi:Uma2 family endonuclease